MRLAHFDDISPSLIDTPLPWRQSQTCSMLPRVLALAGLAAVALLLVVPLAVIVHHVATAPAGLAALANHPAATFQIALGLAVSSALLGFPFYRMAQRIGVTRRVAIEAGSVTVTDQGLAGDHTWSEPLSSYTGIAHHVRTTQAGPRHELVLVHPDPRRHVTVAVAGRISKTELERAAATLAMVEVPAHLLYRLPRLPSLTNRPAATPAHSSRGAEGLAAVEV